MSDSIPLYRRHKNSGRAVVTLPDGRGGRRDIYLGKYGTAASRREYARVIGEWETLGCRLPADAEIVAADLTMNELMAAYWRHVQSYYVKDGRPTSEPGTIRQAMRFVKQLYGDTLARDFGGLALRAIRDRMIVHKVICKMKERDPETGAVREVEKVLREGLSRTFINSQISRIKQMFRWAVGHDMLPPEVYDRLACVEGLRKGKSAARERKPVRSVAEAVVEATLPHVPPMIADMVQVQRLTGARPGELARMRAMEIDMTGPVWEYRPGRHKTEHHDRERIIFIGPKAQAIIRNYLTLDLTAPLFRPSLSEQHRNLERRASRKTAMTPSATKRRARQNPRSLAGEEYAIGSYRRAVARACEKAGLPTWTPNQLRRNAATEVRKRYGLEAAQAVLGHAELGVTQIYAEKDLETARRVMAEIG